MARGKKQRMPRSPEPRRRVGVTEDLQVDGLRRFGGAPHLGEADVEQLLVRQVHAGQRGLVGVPVQPFLECLHSETHL